MGGEGKNGAAGRKPGRLHLRAWRIFSASRMVVLLAVLAVGLTLACGVLGYGLAHQSDERLWAGQRASLRNAIDEFRTWFGKSDAVDPRFVRVVEQSVGLKDLKFETDPPPGEREMQPVLDARGRIAGFLTWEKTYPMTAAMQRLTPLAAAVAIALLVFAAFSLRQLSRARGELAASEERARHAADTDKLTGLPNHAKMLDMLDLALAQREEGQVTSFALIELDGMADITANLGALQSDELIVAIAKALKEALPAEAVCSRIGSDKFAVLFTAGDVDNGALLCGALEAVARPHWIERVVRISAHAGFAQAPSHATTRGELTRRAGLALRAAAKKGPGSVVAFEAAQDSVSAEQKFIARELPRALTANELELHYQPIVAAQGGKMVGVEVLLRWTHVTRGAIPPATFIPVAEQTGLINTLGAFVLRRALSEAKRWPDLRGGQCLAAAGARRLNRRTGA